MLVKTDGKFGGKPGGKRTEKRKDKCFLFKNMRGETKIEEDELSFLIYIQQDATLHSLFYLKLLYIFQVVPPPIIRSASNCIYSIWYLSHRYCYLPL